LLVGRKLLPNAIRKLGKGSQPRSLKDDRRGKGRNLLLSENVERDSLRRKPRESGKQLPPGRGKKRNKRRKFCQKKKGRMVFAEGGGSPFRDGVLLKPVRRKEKKSPVIAKRARLVKPNPRRKGPRDQSHR